MGRGIAGACLAFALEQAAQAGDTSLRVDTHPGNHPMGRALEKAGFRRCGQIDLVGGPEDGDLRIAYERVLPLKNEKEFVQKATKCRERKISRIGLAIPLWCGIMLVLYHDRVLNGRGKA